MIFAALFDVVHDVLWRKPAHVPPLIEWLRAQVATLPPEAREWMRLATASQIATLAALSAVCAPT